MLTKNQIINKINEVCKDKIIGYEYYKKSNMIIPIFKSQANRHDIPTSGGTLYLNAKTEEIGFLTLLEILDLNEKPITVKF